MNHYETLGVQPNASPDDIKAGYRRESSKAHPDRKGGSEERMKAINRAYEVLCNPDRRARYDAGEDDAERDSVDSQAAKLLTKLFVDAIEGSGNMVWSVRRDLDTASAQVAKQVASLKRKIESLEKRRARVKVKSGRNIAHEIIDAQVADARHRIGRFEEARLVSAKAKEMLDLYESDEPVVPEHEQAMQDFDRLVGRFFARRGL